MKLRDLHYAVAVAEFSHFGRAAEACRVSQPALSGQIKKLEGELGVPLFERTNRAVRITAAGEEIIAQAREVLAQVARIEATAKAHVDPLAGRLRLGLIPTIGPYLTPILLPSVRHNLPGLELRLREDLTLTLETELLAGRIDAAVTATTPADPRLDEIPLYDEPFWVALPAKHSLAAEEEVDITGIEPDQLLLLADGHCLRDQVLSFCKVSDDETARVNTQQTSLATILALVGAGVGATLVPATNLGGSWVTDSGIALRREKSRRASRAVRLIFRASYPGRVLLERMADIVCAIVPDTVSPARR
ncbi:MAG: LysR substrate-binding domain-containing protein [Alphaproteobacteria bacterium]|jgi:LysR family hydrogen peroxide-inducible transcriptional activator|nr:LysR substrate-binding domain-containing protein [Alphaproteobacteria bacterium]